MTISVIFPVFNEKDYIRETVQETISILQDFIDDFEIIIVDDASTDGTGEIAEELAQQYSNIKVAYHKKNRTLGGTLKTGFNLASKKFTLYMDIDRPFDLREVRKALNIAQTEKADMVCVYRLNDNDEGFKRYICHIGYNFLINIVFGVKIKDVNFSFKLIRTDLLKQLRIRSEGSFIDAEILIKGRRNGAKIIQFGTQYFPRLRGKSKLSSLSVIFKILQEALLFRLRIL